MRVIAQAAQERVFGDTVPLLQPDLNYAPHVRPRCNWVNSLATADGATRRHPAHAGQRRLHVPCRRNVPPGAESDLCCQGCVARCGAGLMTGAVDAGRTAPGDVILQGRVHRVVCQQLCVRDGGAGAAARRAPRITVARRTRRAREQLSGAATATGCSRFGAAGKCAADAGRPTTWAACATGSPT